MAAARCPTPSPSVEPMASHSGGEVSAATTATATAPSAVGGTPNSSSAARALLGLAAQPKKEGGGIGVGGPTSTMTAEQQPQPPPSGEENVCNYQSHSHSTTMMNAAYAEEAAAIRKQSKGHSTKRPREEEVDPTLQQRQQQRGGDDAGDTTIDYSKSGGGERPTKKHSPGQQVVHHRLLQEQEQQQQPERNMKNEKDNEKKMEGQLQEEEEDGYGPGGGFIGPHMLEEQQQQPEKEQLVLYQPKRHQWPNQADAIAAAAAQLDREEEMGMGMVMGGIGSGGGAVDRFHLLGDDANEIHLHEDDPALLLGRRDGTSASSPSNTAATEEDDGDDDDDDDDTSSPERMEVVRPVPFRVPEKVPRYGILHQLQQQNQHRERGDEQQPQQLQLQLQHRVQPSPITSSRRTSSRGLSSAPPLASSRYDHNRGGTNNGDEERRDDAIAIMADSPSWGADGDEAIARQRQLQRQQDGLNTVPRYGAGRAVVQPFGNSGVATDSIGGYGGGGGGGGGGESYRGLSDNDAIFGDSPDDDDDLYNGAGSFDQDGNYYGPAVQSREEEKKDEDDANHPLGPKTKLDSMFVSAGSQMPIGVDVAGVGFADSESLSSSRHIDLQARPQPKTKGRTGPRKKVARKSQKAGIENFRATSQLIVARPRPRRTRKLRISRRKIEDILACANNRRTENIMKMVEDVTAADIPAIVTSLIDPFQAGRGSENILLYLNCRDLAKASQISKNFQFWVQREISEKVLDYKRKTSLAWEVVKEEKWVHSADDCVKTKDFALTMKCASSIEGTDEKWGSIPTHMDVIEKLAGWCGGWLQFLYAREHGARPQPRSPTDRNKTILGVHVKKRGGGALPQAAVIFDIRRNGKWVWSGIRPISKEYLDRGTDKTDGLLRIYPFSEKTVGKSTDVEPPSHLGSTEARRASSFLISTAYDDQRTFTISASLVSEVSAETLIHDVSFIPRYLCRSLWNEREFHSLGTDHWDVGEGKYWNERLVACSEDGQHPTECNMYVADEERLVSYSHKNNAILERSHIYFHNCFWLDQEPSSTRDGSGEKPFIHMMTELVCERELITEMLLNIHV